MVAQLLRLRFALLLAAARRGARDRARLVTSFVLVVLCVAVAWVGLLSLRGATVSAAQAVTVTGGAALALGSLMAPLAIGGVDQLDPRRFRPLGVTTAPLAGSILVASLAGVPVLALLLIAVGVGVLWMAQGAGFSAVAGPVLGVVSALLLGRIARAGAVGLRREERSRELSGILLLVLLIVAVPVGVFLASLDWGPVVPSALTAAARILSFTPFGAAWAIPGAARAGDPLLWVVVLIALVWVAVLTVVWYLVVDRMLHAPDQPASDRVRAGMSWFAVLPTTPGGAVAARSLIYWLYDRRYRVNVVIVPIAAALTAVPLVIAGVPLQYAVLVPLPVAALFFGWLPHNDVAYDGTAVWLHIASGMQGIADRFGRIVPILLIAIPVFAVFTPVTIMITGRWAFAPALIGAVAALFFSALGLSSIASAVAPYPVSRPDDSPFRQPQRTGAAAVWSQLLVMVGALVLSIPTLWWGWLTVSGHRDMTVAALSTGLVTGALVFGLGLAVGSILFERRGSAIMEFAETAA